MRLRERTLKLAAPPRLLVITAVGAESAAVRRGFVHSGPSRQLALHVIEGGVGSAQAAAVTAASIVRADLQGEPYLAVVCAGIAGGFTGIAGVGDIGVEDIGVGDIEVGDIVVGRASVAADLGVQTDEGFLTVDDLGLGSSIVESDGDLLTLLRKALPRAALGTILTVSTVTGTADRAATLRSRYPWAAAEAMEGFGVATAAAQAGLGFIEVRVISNPVGPRDREAWRIPDALAALEQVGRALASLEP